MKYFSPVLLFTFLLISTVGKGQYVLPDSTALEAVIVEAYYVSNDDDATDTDGGLLSACSVTYRVFVDMKNGYELQAIYGNENNPLQISSSEDFFNNEDRGEETGDAIGADDLGDNTVALDTWLTMGPASDSHWGVLKSLDDDGSIIGGANNDGGSEAVDGGLIANEGSTAETDFEIPVTDADGLILAEEVPSITTIGVELDLFGDENGEGVFETTSGAWSVLEGVSGINEENQVLIGQFTTSGDLSLRLNLQIGIPDSLQCNHPDCHNSIQFVAELHPDDNVSDVDKDNIFYGQGLMYVSDASSFLEDCTVAIDEIQSNLDAIDVYPNPASTFFTIQLPQTFAGKAQMDVFNNHGALCISEQINSNGMNEFSTENLTSGLYYVVVSAEGQKVSRKLVID